jgi:hypothetical protein
MRSLHHQATTPAITVFAALNFVLAGLCAVWLLLVGAILVYGIGFSGDRGKELATGIAGCVLFALPGLLALVIYLPAGFGLLRRRNWGYYLHCAGAVLAAFTCIGLVYAVPAFLFALQPEFSTPFFRREDERPPGDGGRHELWMRTEGGPTD